MASLLFEACHTFDTVSYNYHTRETVGSADDAFDLDVLATEFKT